MMIYITGKLFSDLCNANIPSELIITVKNYIDITSFKMKGSPHLGQADTQNESCISFDNIYMYMKIFNEYVSGT